MRSRAGFVTRQAPSAALLLAQDSSPANLNLFCDGRLRIASDRERNAMKLYTVVGSPNCRKVEAVLGHLGIAVEREYLDFFAGDLRQPAYLALNPNGMVPTVVDGGLV